MKLKFIQHVSFLKWWLFISVVVGGFTILYQNNVFNMIWAADITKLSFFIIGLFWLMSLWCGIQTWKANSLFNLQRRRSSKMMIDFRVDKSFEVNKLKRAAEIGWFASDFSLSVGMIGTVIGFIIMLSGFGGVNLDDIQNIKDLFKELSFGMSIALYTTLTGLVCGSLLKIQFFNLDHILNKITEE